MTNQTDRAGLGDGGDVEPLNRIDAAMKHLDQRVEGGRCREMVADMLAAADAVDPLRVPSPHLAGKVPLVLYFATRTDADEFTAVVKDAFANPVEIVL